MIAETVLDPSRPGKDDINTKAGNCADSWLQGGAWLGALLCGTMGDLCLCTRDSRAPRLLSSIIFMTFFFLPGSLLFMDLTFGGMSQSQTQLCRLAVLPFGSNYVYDKNISEAECKKRFDTVYSTAIGLSVFIFGVGIHAPDSVMASAGVSDVLHGIDSSSTALAAASGFVNGCGTFGGVSNLVLILIKDGHIVPLSDSDDPTEGDADPSGNDNTIFLLRKRKWLLFHQICIGIGLFGTLIIGVLVWKVIPKKK